MPYVDMNPPWAPQVPAIDYGQWPTTYTYSFPRQLSDAELDALAEKIIEKIEARGYEIVKAIRSDEV